MKTLFKSFPTQVEALPDFEGVKNRFLASFPLLGREKKEAAIQTVLRQEFLGTQTLHQPAFLAQVLQRVDDEVLMEKPYIFISVNPSA